MRIQTPPGRSPSRTLLALGVALLLLPGCQEAESSEIPLVPVSDGLDVQAHRGARGLKPENTLPAFEIALDLEVTTLELDAHYSADGQVIIWHDPVVEPLKCGLSEDAPDTIPDPDDPVSFGARGITDLTAQQLTWFQCDRNPEPDRFPDQNRSATEVAGSDYRIVTLAELFEFVQVYAASDEKTGSQRANAARVNFNIETKRRPDDPSTIGDGFNGSDAGPFELALLDLVEVYELGDRVVIQSFDHRSLWSIHKVDSTIRLAALTSDTYADPADFAANGASIWSPRFSTLTEQHVVDAHNAGLEVIPWTVNETADMATMISIGVDGIITDRPDLLLSISS
jgi:glycerophosphoryl diester phosphodiesterase